MIHLSHPWPTWHGQNKKQKIKVSFKLNSKFLKFLSFNFKNSLTHNSSIQDNRTIFKCLHVMEKDYFLIEGNFYSMPFSLFASQTCSILVYSLSFFLCFLQVLIFASFLPLLFLSLLIYPLFLHSFSILFFSSGSTSCFYLYISSFCPTIHFSLFSPLFISLTFLCCCFFFIILFSLLSFSYSFLPFLSSSFFDSSLSFSSLILPLLFLSLFSLPLYFSSSLIFFIFMTSLFPILYLFIYFSLTSLFSSFLFHHSFLPFLLLSLFYILSLLPYPFPFFFNFWPSSFYSIYLSYIYSYFSPCFTSCCLSLSCFLPLFNHIFFPFTLFLFTHTPPPFLFIFFLLFSLSPSSFFFFLSFMFFLPLPHFPYFSSLLFLPLYFSFLLLLSLSLPLLLPFLVILSFFFIICYYALIIWILKLNIFVSPILNFKFLSLENFFHPNDSISSNSELPGKEITKWTKPKDFNPVKNICLLTTAAQLNWQLSASKMKGTFILIFRTFAVFINF